MKDGSGRNRIENRMEYRIENRMEYRIEKHIKYRIKMKRVQ